MYPHQQARQTKAKSRIEAFYKLEKSTKPRVGDPNLSLNANDGQRRLGGNIIKVNNRYLWMIDY